MPDNVNVADKKCNFRQSRRASAQGRFDKGCNRNLFHAVKLAAEVFLFDGGALVVDLLAFG